MSLLGELLDDSVYRSCARIAYAAEREHARVHGRVLKSWDALAEEERRAAMHFAKLVLRNDVQPTPEEDLRVDVIMAVAKVYGILAPNKPLPQSVSAILKAVCEQTHVGGSAMTGTDRHKSVAFARHLAMFMVHRFAKLSYPETGRIFGNRDHTTVMSACRKIEGWLETDPLTRSHVYYLCLKLGLEPPASVVGAPPLPETSVATIPDLSPPEVPDAA